MKARVNQLTCEQRKAINKVVRQNVSEQMVNIQFQLDALWLNALRRSLGWGPKRLKRIYKEYFDMRREFINFYESDGYDGMPESASVMELHNVGCDVRDWYDEFGESRVDYHISKGETQSMREARERSERRNNETLR